ETRRPGRPWPSTESRRNFFLQTGSDPRREASYQLISAILVGETPGLRIWWDADSARPTATEFVARLADCVESAVLPKVCGLLGEITDLDEDGTLAICLTSRLSELPPRETPVQGLVQLNDFQPHLPRPFSNHSDVMFLSPEIQLD